MAWPDPSGSAETQTMYTEPITYKNLNTDANPVNQSSLLMNAPRLRKLGMRRLMLDEGVI